MRMGLGSALAALLLAPVLGCTATEADPSYSLGTDPPEPEPEPARLEAEAGFLDIPAQPAGADYPARMFYSFRPAEIDPEGAPLLVLFNGGPGSPTTSHLMAYGTGPRTLRVDMEVGDAPIDNPARLSRFAHLLYLDARQAGLSYGIHPQGEQCAGAVDALLDAGDFTRALLDFLAERPALRDRRVVIVGESYGGARSATMLLLLQHYAAPPAPQAGLPDFARLPWLRERVQAHLDQAFPERAGEAWAPEEVAAQFGWQVLIQPGFAGNVQRDFQQSYILADPLLQGYPHVWEGDLDVRVSDEEEARRNEIAERAVLDPDHFEALTGVAAAEVEGLGAEARAGGFRTPYDDDTPADEGELRALLGELEPGDSYWSTRARVCNVWTGDVPNALAFLDLTRRTRAFITRARYDTRVYTAALPGFFADVDQTLGVTTDQAPRPGVERPGWIHLVHATGERAEIRFPAYVAGHGVATTNAVELAGDVEVWLREAGAIEE